MTTTALGERVRPWFRADWRDVVFLHFSIDAGMLRRVVPFELDLHDGRAWVSLVAFTQVGLRPAVGGRVGRLLMSAVGTHPFLNLRTYVRGPEGEPAIYFIAEWIPNRLSLVTGPMMYGLPFRLGTLEYQEDRGRVEAAGRALAFRVLRSGDAAGPGEFLLERYAAFTCHRGRRRRFDIEHGPWEYEPVDASIDDAALISAAAPWFRAARFECAHRSPGVRDVAIGGPVLTAPRRRRPSAAR